MLEKEYWYAVLKDDEDDWYYGNTNLHTAMELAREIGLEAFIAVIDDSNLLHPYCVWYITQSEFKEGMEIREERRRVGS